MTASDAPKPSVDIGPVFHPEDPDYITRWHEARGDVEDAPGSGVWRDPSSGVVIDVADYPLPADYEPGFALEKGSDGKWHMPKASAE